MFAVPARRNPDKNIVFKSGDVAPDSRLTTVSTPRNAFQGEMGWMQPSFCASCGKRGPDVPTENMTFMFWLCTPCFGRYGELAGTLVVPDEVFWQNIKDESLESFGRELSPAELDAVVTANTTPLAKLIIEGR